MHARALVVAVAATIGFGIVPGPLTHAARTAVQPIATNAPEPSANVSAARSGG